MKNKISRESRVYRELKDLWNQFDPIGVYGEDSDWLDDEYESYIIPTFAFLEKKADFNTLYSYIHALVNTHMGVDWVKDEYIVDFVQRIQKWHENLLP